MRYFGFMTAFLVVCATTTSGCEEDADPPEPTAQSPQVSQATQQPDESGEQGAAAAPQPSAQTDDEETRRADETGDENPDTAESGDSPQEFDADEQSATFVRPGGATGDEDFAVLISPTESTELPLYAEPDESAEIVDHLEIDEHEHLRSRGWTFSEGEVETNPAAKDVDVEHLDPLDSTDEDQMTTIEEGEPIGVVEEQLDACGGWVQYIWHDGQSYRVHSGGTRLDLIEDDDDPEDDAEPWEHHGPRQDFSATDSELWRQVDGPELEEGWLFLDSDVLESERVPHSEIAPDDHVTGR